MKNSVKKIENENTFFHKIFISKFFIYIASIIYFYSIYLVNLKFSSIFYFDYGFESTYFSINDLILLTILTFIGTIFLPRKLNCSSAIFLVIIYFFVIVPFQVVGLSGGNSYDSQRYTVLFVIHLCFLACCLLCVRKKFDKPPKQPVNGLFSSLVLVWAITSVALIYIFKDIMTIAGLDAIYAQRELGKAANFWIGYLQTYNQYVFSPALVAIGLANKRPFVLLFGFAGAVLNYSITAEKAGLMYPAFVVILYLMVSSKSKFASASSLIPLGLAALLYISIVFQDENGRTDFILWYLGTRTLLIPGTFISLYQDFFSAVGYTNFSHIRGLNLFIDIPDPYLLDSRWPAIGLILGEDYLKIPTLNANANFIASDGLAGLGLGGIPIAFLVLAIYLRVIDRVTEGIDIRLTLPVLLPVALTLTNGSVFTVLTSFGGIFWIIVFGVFFKKIPLAEANLNTRTQK